MSQPDDPMPVLDQGRNDRGERLMTLLRSTKSGTRLEPTQASPRLSESSSPVSQGAASGRVGTGSGSRNYKTTKSGYE